MDHAMMKALEADGEKLRQLTGEDHGPVFLPEPSPSPFLPGTQIQFAWDSTSIGYFKTCPRLYQYIILEGWTTEAESVHLRFGQEFHKALEDFDRAIAFGASRQAALRKVVQELLTRTVGWEPDEDTKAGKYKNRRTLLALVIDYVDHYADDAARTYIKRDETPAVELSFRFELDWGPRQGQDLTATQVEERLQGKFYTSVGQPYLLCGHLDRVVTFADDLYVMDRKTTTTTLSSYYFEQYSPNNQMTLYTLASQVILGSPVKGVIIDAAQVLLSEPNRFVRGITYRTPDQLEEWLADLKVLLAEAEGYATAGYWPQRDTSCDKFGGCRFRQVCAKSPQVREQFLKAKFVKLAPEDRWDPLKPR